jgi:multidrug efflux pump subunit AcrA (membrane-fusion protein)
MPPDESQSQQMQQQMQQPMHSQQQQTQYQPPPGADRVAQLEAALAAERKRLLDAESQIKAHQEKTSKKTSEVQAQLEQAQQRAAELEAKAKLADLRLIATEALRAAGWSGGMDAGIRLLGLTPEMDQSAVEAAIQEAKAGFGPMFSGSGSGQNPSQTGKGKTPAPPPPGGSPASGMGQEDVLQMSPLQAMIVDEMRTFSEPGKMQIDDHAIRQTKEAFVKGGPWPINVRRIGGFDEYFDSQKRAARAAIEKGE